MKFLVAKPSPDRKISFLLNEANELFARETIWEAEEDFEADFGAKLQIGKIFSTANGDYYFFAAATNEIEKLPDGWNLVGFAELNADNCPDYDAIATATKMLGY